MRRSNRHSLWKWILASVAIHILIVLLPSQLLESIFPRSKPIAKGPPKDLVPHFQEVAIEVLSVGGQAKPEVEVVLSEEPKQEPFPEEQEIYGSEDVIPVEETSSGTTEGTPTPGESKFFPPVPRFIVPPAIAELGPRQITVRLRILVDKEGRPTEIVLLEELEDAAVQEKIVAAAMEFRFEPARLGTEPVESWVELPLNLQTSKRK